MSRRGEEKRYCVLLAFEDEKRFFMMKRKLQSHFAWGHPVDGVWTVEDQYTDNGPYKTVTNDAENVVQFLVDAGMGSNDLIVYRDTEGNWDEIVHKDGLFFGFSSLNTRNRNQAIEMALLIRYERLKDVLENLLNYVVRNTCSHDITRRGGASWTICEGCGKKWYDDEGGFQPYKDPPEIAAAKKALMT